MALMDDLRTKLTAIGNAIRSKTGGSDPLTLDGMVDAINGISTGGGGGGGGGSSGGSISYDGMYTINFYDAEKNFIESHSAKYGFWIDKPLSYEAESWHNSDGHMNHFPLTVTSEEAGDKPSIIYDLYAANAQNSFYVIDPNGTNFNSTFFKAPGVPQSTSGSFTGDNMNPVYAGNQNGFCYRLGGTYNGHNYSFVLNDAIVCTQYRWLKVKYYSWDPDYSYNAAHIYLAKDKVHAGNGLPSNYYYLTNVAGTNTTAPTDMLKDPDNEGWQVITYDLTDIEQFYLGFQVFGAIYIVEAVLVM